jgi:drug/metabolite transporter (DMT)-like permease
MLLTGTSGVDMNRGDWLILLAALLRAFMMCSTKRMLQNAEIPAVALTAVEVGVVGFGSLIILLFTTDSLPPLPTEMSFWLATVYLVLFCTLFAFFAQNYALRYTTPTRASLLMGAEPLFGACFAVMWLDEQLTPLAWCGGVLIVVASMLGLRPPKSAKAVAVA